MNTNNNFFQDLEAKLSAHGKHAFETYQIAFWRSGQKMTVGEIRASIRALYGEVIDEELEEYLKERRNKVLPEQLRY